MSNTDKSEQLVTPDEIIAKLTRNAGMNNKKTGYDMFKSLGKGVWTDQELRDAALRDLERYYSRRSEAQCKLAKMKGQIEGIQLTDSVLRNANIPLHTIQAEEAKKYLRQLEAKLSAQAKETEGDNAK